MALGSTLLMCGQPAPEPDRDAVSTVLEVRRAPDVDVILLRDGGRMAGRLQGETLRLRAAWGDISVAARWVAGIELGGSERELDSVVTVNRNRFSGFLQQPVFELQPADGTGTVAVRSEKVLKVILHQRADEESGLTRGAWVLLRNGDFFSGQLRQKRFHREDVAGELEWSLESVTSVTFAQGGERGARLVLTNGITVLARAQAEDLEFDLDLGMRLSLYQDRIEEIRSPGALPAALRQRLGLAVSAQAPGSAADRLPDPNITPGPGMVWIPPGEFTWGSTASEKDRDLDEGPLTQVVFTNGFWIGQHEITQAEYEAVMGTNPSHHQGDGRLPVEKVSWQDAIEYCRKRTERVQASGRLPATHTFRLPTEAEWEYACRAGTTTRFGFGDDRDGTVAHDFAWLDSNSGSGTHPVGLRKPNAWGLFDMHGNVWEWCLDAWQGSLPGGSLTHRPVRPEGTLRAARGGSWLYEARFARSANRDSYGLANRCSDVGFRVVLAPAL